LPATVIVYKYADILLSQVADSMETSAFSENLSVCKLADLYHFILVNLH